MALEGTVIIVDDDEAVRDSLQAIMESYGLTVVLHGSGTDFLGAGPMPDPCCLLLDIRMPDISGLAVQERLVAAGRTIPVIIITGHGDVPLAVQTMKAGAFDFVEKPFTDDVLVERVALALEKSRTDSEMESEVQRLNETIATLTPRERDVLHHLVLGRSNKIIAYELGISPRTVEVHRARVMEKTGAGSLSELVRMSLAAGLGTNK